MICLLLNCFYSYYSLLNIFQFAKIMYFYECSKYYYHFSPTIPINVTTEGYLHIQEPYKKQTWLYTKRRLAKNCQPSISVSFSCFFQLKKSIERNEEIIFLSFLYQQILVINKVCNCHSLIKSSKFFLVYAYSPTLCEFTHLTL